MSGKKVTANFVAVLCSSLLFVLFTSAQNQKKTTAPSQGSTAPKSGGSSARPAPSQRPSGSGGSQRPPTHSGTGSGGNNANKGTASGANRGTPTNTNKGSSTGENRPTPNNSNKGTATGANRPAPTSANKGSSTGANRATPNNSNKGTATGAARPASSNPNKSNAAGGNRSTTTNANGGTTTSANRSGNTNINRHQPAGTKTVALKNGGSAVYRQNGQVRTIQTNGMTINRGMHGSTRVVSTRHGTTIVGYGRGGGYNQRAYYTHGGRAYVQRTYYVGGRYYAYGYRSYSWGGRPYYGYAPPYYWRPTYYRWAYNPWPAPVYYSWGWGRAPWYGYYGPYFAPYPVYPTAAFWLTDYMIAANLQAAYAAQQSARNGEAGPQPGATQSANAIASLWTSDPLIAENSAENSGYAYAAYPVGAPADDKSPQLTPEVKQAIADLMKDEIAAEQAAAASGNKDTPTKDQIPAALDPKIRTFVVSSDLDLTTSDGTECALTPGDVVYRVGDKPDADNMVDATVKSSKKDECAVSATVSIDSGDLQEMHNQLRIQMDAGLKELADKQGKDGIPPAPDTQTQSGEVPPPKPDESVATDLQQQQKDAAQAEAQLPN
jgi:hypothetical protein